MGILELEYKEREVKAIERVAEALEKLIELLQEETIHFNVTALTIDGDR